MLHEFMAWSESKMRKKGEEFSADHMAGLLDQIENMGQSEAMRFMHRELEFLDNAMKVEQCSVEHGVLWSNKLNVEQSIRGGNGELWFADHVPNNG